jgi:hypothetical protein
MPLTPLLASRSRMWRDLRSYIFKRSRVSRNTAAGLKGRNGRGYFRGVEEGRAGATAPVLNVRFEEDATLPHGGCKLVCR